MRTPEEIIDSIPAVDETAILPRIGKPAVQALIDAGYVIVDREKLGAVLRAQVRSDKLTDQIIDELAQERGGT